MDDVTVLPVNGSTENEEKPTDLDRLHNLVHKIEENNDLPSPKSSEKKFDNVLYNGCSIDTYSLENTSENIDFETNVDSEDSWLYESPQKIQTPGKGVSTDKWLKENLTTPELMRVRGSLSAKLDVINFEKRKGRFSNTDPQHRKISHNRKESTHSVNSLDWDWEYGEEKNPRHHATERSHLSNEEFGGYSYDDEFDPEEELKSAHSNLPSVHIERQAWSEPAQHGINNNTERPFTLDWSDDEDELSPMKIDFNSPNQPHPRSIVAPQNGTVVRRGVSGIDALATPRQPENYDYDDFVARPTGVVKPRRAVVPASMPDYDEPDFTNDDFDDSAPVVPRGAIKRAKSLSGVKRTTFGEILIHPVGVNDYGIRLNQTTQLLKNVHNTPSPNSGIGIVKPVQRRKAGGDPQSGIRPRGSGNNLVKARGTGANVPKSYSSPDIADQSLVARLPAGGDGPLLRRRGAGDSAGGNNGGIPTPRKSKESPQIARVQGIPQVRRSTGSIPTKNNDVVARPRRSASPSGIVRPRGSGVTQSVQANY